MPARLRRCLIAAESNGPDKSPDYVMAKTYRQWRPFLGSPDDLKKREKTEGVSGAVLARLVRQALELHWERCLDLSLPILHQHQVICQASLLPGPARPRKKTTHQDGMSASRSGFTHQAVFWPLASSCPTYFGDRVRVEKPSSLSNGMQRSHRNYVRNP